LTVVVFTLEVRISTVGTTHIRTNFLRATNRFAAFKMHHSHKYI